MRTPFGQVSGPFLAVGITCFVSLLAMGSYLWVELLGNIDHHVLPARMFGVPEALRAKGFDEFFVGPRQTGWDGQFYFYMANDPLALRDTPQHIDAHAYRYQRIGLSAVARVVSFVFLQDWVSPTVYYLTNLGLVLIATFYAARFFVISGFPWWVALFWALGFGTQVTMLNGLPDAAADAFVIIGLTSLFRGRVLLYSIALTLAALSREAYVLFPIAILGLTFLFAFRERGSVMPRMVSWLRSPQILAHIVPVLIFAAWQVWIRVRFGVSPSSQAHGVLGLPLVSLWSHLVSGLRGKHLLVSPGAPSYWEAGTICLFVALLSITATFAAGLLLRGMGDPRKVGVGCALLLLIALYLCFGKTVMMHHTGYLKASNLFLFGAPFLLCLSERTMPSWMIWFMVVLTAACGQRLYDRVSTCDMGYERFTRVFEVSSTATSDCLSEYRAVIKPLAVEELTKRSWFNRLFGREVRVIWVEVMNQGRQPFVACCGAGAVNVSYHWRTKDGRTVVRDGIRSCMPGGLPPGARRVVPIVVEWLSEPGDYILTLSLVQEGCSWFYLKNPANAFDIPYRIR